MVAHLLLAIAGGDAESPLSGDVLMARQLATLLGEDDEVSKAIARVLIEPSCSPATLPHIQVRLGKWDEMRSQLVNSVVEHAGSTHQASALLGVPARWVRREEFRARRITHEHQ